MHNPLVKRHSGTLILLSGGQPLWQQKNARYRSAHIPWGIAKRQRTGQNPWAAAILNFFFVGLGYNYLGFWWGFLVFMSYMSIFTLAQLESGPFTPYLYAYPITALFAAQTFYMAKKRSDL